MVCGGTEGGGGGLTQALIEFPRSIRTTQK